MLNGKKRGILLGCGSAFHVYLCIVIVFMNIFIVIKEKSFTLKLSRRYQFGLSETRALQILVRKVATADFL